MCVYVLSESAKCNEKDVSELLCKHIQLYQFIPKCACGSKTQVVKSFICSPVYMYISSCLTCSFSLQVKNKPHYREKSIRLFSSWV